jgi:hypothetical protein
MYFGQSVALNDKHDVFSIGFGVLLLLCAAGRGREQLASTGSEDRGLKFSLPSQF